MTTFLLSLEFSGALFALGKFILNIYFVENIQFVTKTIFMNNTIIQFLILFDQQRIVVEFFLS